jgi:pyridoxine 5-phosphate synthase
VVSAFVDPDPAQIQASADAGFGAIEIHTGTYANAWTPAGGGAQEAATEQIRQGLALGLGAGLIVHGGHGLTYDNIHPIAAMDGFCEFNIGHSIVARAVFVGIREAVREMKRLIDAHASRESR